MLIPMFHYWSSRLVLSNKTTGYAVRRKDAVKILPPSILTSRHQSTHTSSSSSSSTIITSRKHVLQDTLSLKDFLNSSVNESVNSSSPSIQSQTSRLNENNELKDIDHTHPSFDTSIKFYIETYGCQMNSADSDIVRSVLIEAGHIPVNHIDDAQLVLTNTCAIRENAENKVFHRLNYFHSIQEKNYQSLSKSMRKKVQSGLLSPQLLRVPMVGVLGCMAERLKEKLLDEKAVDLVCGPDAYRDLPRLIQVAVTKIGQNLNIYHDNLMENTNSTILSVTGDQLAANTQLSLDETYADIVPTRESQPAIASSAFISIMRGCNNMCSFCIVPFTRGRERSRPIKSILSEIKLLVNPTISTVIPVREVVLLGQNVNGYHDVSSEGAINYPYRPYQTTEGFSNLYRSKKQELPGPRFIDLLDEVSNIHPELRVRFTSPHPKDFPEEVLDLIASRPNICKSLHLPLQSGSSSVLSRMRRGYTKEAFLSLVERCRAKIPDVSLSTDVIAGFCDETEAEHQDTLDVMRQIQFDQAFMFSYSLRDRTHAAHTMEDNILPEIKQRRLQEIIQVYQKGVIERNRAIELGQYRLVLIEGPAKRNGSEDITMATGRTDGNKRVVFPLCHNQILFTSISEYNRIVRTVHTLSPQSLPLNSYSNSSNRVSSIHTINGIINKHSDLEEVHRIYQRSLSSFFQSSNTSFHPDLQITMAMTKMNHPSDLYGTYVVVKILRANGPTLRGVVVAKSSITEFTQHLSTTIHSSMGSTCDNESNNDGSIHRTNMIGIQTTV